MRVLCCTTLVKSETFLFATGRLKYGKIFLGSFISPTYNYFVFNVEPVFFKVYAPFTLEPKVLAGGLDLPDTVRVGHVEHGPPVHLKSIQEIESSICGTKD